MYAQTFQVLTPAEIYQVMSGLSPDLFVDGKKTASGLARDVKHNLQVDRTGAALTNRDNLILSALARNAAFQAFVIPSRIMVPSYSRYEIGMSYGAHVDSAVMGAGNDAVRTDLAMTIFLSEPETYDGGELIIEQPLGEQEVKLPAGEAIVYPANTLHRVAPVTGGIRLAAITWIQSKVPDERLRAILCDLNTALEKAAASGNVALAALLNKSYHNLLRYAANV